MALSSAARHRIVPTAGSPDTVMVPDTPARALLPARPTEETHGGHAAKVDGYMTHRWSAVGIAALAVAASGGVFWLRRGALTAR